MTILLGAGMPIVAAQTFDPSPPFTDTNYHEYLLYNVDTAQIDVVILPPAGPLTLRNIQLLKQGVESWDAGVDALAPPWLRNGLDIDAYVLGIDPIPPEVLWDPEVIVMTAEPYPVVRAFVGLGFEPVGFVDTVTGTTVYACHGQPMPDAQELVENPGFHQHPGSYWGSNRYECDYGGSTCFVINTNWFNADTAPNMRDMYDLNSHEVGHCLGIGHVGDADDFSATAYPRDDIMSYENDGWNPSYVLCVSSLNVRALEYTYAHILDQVAQRETQGRYVHMTPSEWRAHDCDQPTATFTDVDVLTSADPLGTPDDDDEQGSPTITITSPDDGTDVAAGALIVEGLVDRQGGTGAPLGAAITAADRADVGQPVELVGEAFGGNAEVGYSCAWSDDSDASSYSDPDACQSSVTFEAPGDYVVTLVVDDGTSTAEDTHAIRVETPSGLPKPDGSIAGGITIFTQANPVVAHNEVLNLATSALGDPAPKFIPGEPVSLRTRFTLDSTKAIGPDGAPFTWHMWRSDGTLVDTVKCNTRNDAPTTGTDRPDDFDCIAGYTMPQEFGRYYTTLRSDTDGRWSCHNGVPLAVVVAYDGPACLKAFDVGLRDDVAPPTGGGSIGTPDAGRVTAVGGDEACVLTLASDPPADVTPGRRDLTAFGAGEDATNWYVCFVVSDFSQAPTASPVAATEQTRYSFTWTAGYEGPGVGYSARAVYNRDGSFNSASFLKGYFGVSAGALGGPLTAERNGNTIKIILPKSAIGAPASGAQATAMSATSGDNGQGNGLIADRAPATGSATYTFGSGQPLTADAGGPYTGAPGAEIELTGSFAGGDGSGACSWSTSHDGTFSSSTSCSTTVTFASVGEKSVRLTVTDGTGSKSDDADVTVSEISGGERVEIYAGGQLVGAQPVATSSSDPKAAFEVSVDLSAFTGTTTLQAKWYDAEDNLLATDAVDVNVQETVPHVVAFTSHEDGSEVPEGPTSFEGIVRRPGPARVAPEVTITPESASAETGDELVFAASVTGDPTPICQWTVVGEPGDVSFVGSTTDCAAATITSSTARTITLRLTATNSVGTGSDTANATWVDPGTPLSARTGGPYSGNIGEPIAITGSAVGGDAGKGFACAWSTPDDGALGDPSSCTTTVTFTSAGSKLLRLTVDDGTTTDEATTSVSVIQEGSSSVRIDNPARGSTVTQVPVVLSGETTNTADGAWLPSTSSSSTRLPSVGDLDPTARQHAGLFWAPWMDGLEERLARHPGFMGLVPSTWSGIQRLDAYYVGDAPAALDGLVVEGGLVLRVHADTTPKSLAFKFPAGFDPSLHRKLVPGLRSDTGSLVGPPNAYEPFLPDTGLWNTGIGPGAPTIQFFNYDHDEDGFEDATGCTANFLWKDQNGKLYLGLAGHCVLPFGEAADHNALGPSGFDSSAIDIEVCVADCITGGVIGGIEDNFLGNYVTLGKVAYARQTGPGSGGLFGLGGGGPGNDFALVEIPDALVDQLDPSMPVWHGPADLNDAPAAGLVTQIHGNSVGYGETFAGKSRLGVSMGRDEAGSTQLGNQVWGNSRGYWMALMPGEMGDSGSAVNTLNTAGGLVPGIDAGRGAGILTHGVGPWNILTKASRAVEMAREAGLCIALVPGHMDPEAFPAPEPEEGVCDGDDTTPKYDVQYSSDGTAWSSVDAFDPVAGTWSASVKGLENGPVSLAVRLLRDGEVIATDAVDFVLDAELTPSCGDEGVLVAQDPADDGTGDAAGEALCLGVQLLPGDVVQLRAMVEDAAALPGGGDDFYYDFWLVPSWTGATQGIWMYATWDGDSFGAPSWVDRDALLPFQILGDPTRPAEVSFRWQDNNPATGVVLAEFPLSNFATMPTSGDEFTGMAFGPNTYNDVELTTYLDCVAGTNTGADCEDRSGVYTFGSSGSPAHMTLPGELKAGASFGPSSSEMVERVELFVDGVFVGSSPVDTSEATEGQWSIPADLPEGTHTVTAEWYAADDTLLAETSISLTAIHQNAPPQAVIVGPDLAEAGQEVLFDGSESADPDGDELQFFWDFGDGATSSGAIVAHAFEAGEFVVQLTVVDDDAAQSVATHAIRVNLKPTAVISGPDLVHEGDEALFVGAESHDEDGTIVAHTWDFGDGTGASGPDVAHSFAPGEYLVRLTVEDNDGSIGVATHTLTVNARPIAVIDAPDSATRAEPLDVDASASSDADGEVVSYHWDFGDGASATGPLASHQYETLGTFTVTLTVTDNDGASSTTSHSVEVVNAGPTAHIEGPASTKKNKAVTFDAAGSSDPDGSIAAYSWNLGDGTTSTSPQVTHHYKKEGAYTVTLTVTDNEGAVASATRTIEVGKDK